MIRIPLMRCDLDYRDFEGVSSQDVLVIGTRDLYLRL